MIVAISILTALLVLIVAVASSAQHVNATTTRAEASGAALASANAGAQVALFRLDTTGTLTGATGSMGNGATYDYAVTTLSSSSSPCTGLWVQNSTQSVQQDCITSVGSVNGVNAQVQARVAGYTPTTSLYPINGVFAVDGFYAAGSPTGAFSLGSNGAMNLTNATLPDINGDLFYQAGQLTQSQNSNQQCSSPCTLVQDSAAITVPSVSPSAYASAATTNNDGAISWPSNLSYSSSTNSVTSNGSNNATVYLPAGTYYFCSLALGNATTIQATGSPVKIYIDSSSDSSTSCPSGSGNLTGDDVTVTAFGGTASNLQLFLYGQPGCTGTNCPADLPQNTATFTADVFAPYSYENDNPLTVTGAMVIGYVYENTLNVTYQGPAASGSSTGGTNADFFPAREAICTPASTPTTGSC